jgi:uncharacterized protein YndB with AHSA1/START domain
MDIQNKAAAGTPVPSGRTLLIERIFDAPRELVWKTWTEPERIALWWGPQYFTAPVCKIDFRVGGKFHYCMRSPEGQDFWSTGTFREIVPLARIVCTDSFADAQGNIVPASYYGMGEGFPDELLVTVTFEDLAGKTRFILRHEGFPPGIHSEMAESGWSTSLDKLADALKG